MDLQLKGKKALVTGSTAGIGFATAKGLAAEGASVVVNGRTTERVEAAIHEIRQMLPDAELSGVAADVASADGCAKLSAAVGEVDVLINNMGIFEVKAFEEIPDADWLRMFEANVMERSATLPPLPARHAEKELGANHFHFQRVRRADSRGDDSLWNDKGGADCRCSGDCRGRGGNGYYREQRAGGSDTVGGSGKIPGPDGRAERR